MRIHIPYTRSFCVMLMLTLLFSTFIYGNFGWQDAYAASSTTVSVSPSNVTASVGQNFTVNVTISDVYDLYGWQFRLNWTAGLIDVINVTEGPFLKLGGGTYFYWDVNATAGRMVADCTLLGNVPGVSGSGTLATITFNVKGVGESPLTLWDVALLNSLEQSISPITLYNGTFNNQGLAPVGGSWSPVDKIALLAPYIGMSIALIALMFITVVHIKRVRHEKEKQQAVKH